MFLFSSRKIVRWWHKRRITENPVSFSSLAFDWFTGIDKMNEWKQTIYTGISLACLFVLFFLLFVVLFDNRFQFCPNNSNNNNDENSIFFFLVEITVSRLWIGLVSFSLCFCVFYTLPFSQEKNRWKAYGLILFGQVNSTGCCLTFDFFSLLSFKKNKKLAVYATGVCDQQAIQKKNSQKPV